MFSHFVLKPGLWGVMWRGVKVSSVSSQINYGLCRDPSVTACTARLIGLGPRSRCMKATLAVARLPEGGATEAEGHLALPGTQSWLSLQPPLEGLFSFSTYSFSSYHMMVRWKWDQLSVKCLEQDSECQGCSTKVVVIVVSVIYFDCYY